MSERYQKLFALPKDQYTEASPVLVSAGQLLKDTLTGRVLAQFKFRSIFPGTLRAIRLQLSCWDSFGAELAEKEICEYLDLSVTREAECGAKLAFPLSNAAVRSFRITAIEACDDEGNIHSVTNPNWVSLPKTESLDAALREEEVVRQFRLERGADAAVLPMEWKDLWFCCCGGLNRSEEDCCHNCRRPADGQFVIDVTALRQAASLRQAREAAERDTVAAETKLRMARRRKLRPNQRFRCLTHTQEQLHAKALPLLITASALLEDLPTGRIIAQIKMRNIGQKPIRAVRVEVQPLDSASRPLGKSIVHDYLDLNAGRGEEFGTQEAIVLPDETTRAFRPKLVEIAYADGSVEDCTACTLEVLPKPQRAELELHESELVKQFSLRYGPRAEYLPRFVSGKWICVCGAVNQDSMSRCPDCGADASLLAAFNLQDLIREKEERLAREEAERQAALAAAAAEKDEREGEEDEDEIGTARGRRPKLGLIVLAGLLVIVLILSGACFFRYHLRYQKAGELMEQGRFAEAAEIYEDLGRYSKSAEYLATAREADMIVRFNKIVIQGLEKDTDLITRRKDLFSLMSDLIVATPFPAKDQMLQRCCSMLEACQVIYAGPESTFAVTKDGEILQAGLSSVPINSSSGWSDIVSLVVNDQFSIGLKADGTLVSAGTNNFGRIDILNWSDIKAVAAGRNHAVALRRNGTVLATGAGLNGECDVDEWKDIVAVAAGKNFTVGLKNDGTVVCACNSESGLEEVETWDHIVAISAGTNQVLGLRYDGTVVAAGKNSNGQCDTSDWKDIVAISAGDCFSVALKTDGTVVATGLNWHGCCDVEDWTNVIAIATGNGHTVGLCSDGSIVTAGSNSSQQCEVEGWTEKLFSAP